VRFIINSSYGNDSVALIAWAHERGLCDVAILFTDTGWAISEWMERVSRAEEWARTLGFAPYRTSSKGFKQLVRDHKAFPYQKSQFCTLELKILPALAWLDEHNPDKRATCLIGVRKFESKERERKNFPLFQRSSPNHGDRPLWAPLKFHSKEERDGLLSRHGWDVLPHRSQECSPCINANRADLKAVPLARIKEIREFEDEIHKEFGLTDKGKRRYFLRPHRYSSYPEGIDECINWAEHGHKNQTGFKFDDLEESTSDCDELGFCGI